LPDIHSSATSDYASGCSYSDSLLKRLHKIMSKLFLISGSTQ
jgi:hypothetical protein